MTNGGWQMTNGGWQVTNGGWQMTNGGWQMTNGGGRMGDNRCHDETGHSRFARARKWMAPLRLPSTDEQEQDEE